MSSYVPNDTCDTDIRTKRLRFCIPSENWLKGVWSREEVSSPWWLSWFQCSCRVDLALLLDHGSISLAIAAESTKQTKKTHNPHILSEDIIGPWTVDLNNGKMTLIFHFLVPVFHKGKTTSGHTPLGFWDMIFLTHTTQMSRFSNEEWGVLRRNECLQKRLDTYSVGHIHLELSCLGSKY